MTTETQTRNGSGRKQAFLSASPQMPWAACSPSCWASPGFAYLIDARNRPPPRAISNRWLRLSELPLNQPQQVVIRDVQRDAWTIEPNQVVGAPGSFCRDKTMSRLSTICPHLGCWINFEETLASVRLPRATAAHSRPMEN